MPKAANTGLIGWTSHTFQAGLWMRRPFMMLNINKWEQGYLDCHGVMISSSGPPISTSFLMRRKLFLQAAKGMKIFFFFYTILIFTIHHAKRRQPNPLYLPFGCALFHHSTVEGSCCVSGIWTVGEDLHRKHVLQYLFFWNQSTKPFIDITALTIPIVANRNLVLCNSVVAKQVDWTSCRRWNIFVVFRRYGVKAQLLL